VFTSLKTKCAGQDAPEHPKKKNNKQQKVFEGCP
jgi:hypothetical protein